MKKLFYILFFLSQFCFSQIGIKAPLGVVNDSITLSNIGTGLSVSSGSLVTSAIPNASLSNSTISGVSLGNNLFNHTVGYGLSGSSYNGSSAIAWTADTTTSTGLMSKARFTAKTGLFLTANQTITYTASGDVTGTASGATSISPTMSLSASQPNITSAANQTTIGTVTVGTWNSIIKPVTTSTTSASTYTIAATTQQMEFTALAANLTLYTSGSPNDGQKLIIRIIDNGSPETLTFNSVFNFGGLVTAPTTTVASKYLYLGFIYNGTTSKWDCVASNQF